VADVFRIKAIKPELLKVKNIRLELLNELRREGKDLKKEFDKTIAGWEGDRPTFKAQVSLAGSEAVVIVWPTGNTRGVEKWVYLDLGTSIRWALMSRNWRSKTKPGKLQSGGGSGRVVIAGRRAMQRRNIPPRPGIKARGWTVKIGRQYKRRFPNRIGLAIKRAKKF
jgi:hypothetical protein